MAKSVKDITGNIYDYLTAIKCVGKVVRKNDPTRSNALWLFQCQCGKQITTLARHVERGFKRSCGCHVRRGWKAVAWHIFNKCYADGDLTFDEFCNLSQQPCFYCQAPPSNHRTINKNSWSYNGLDRLVNSRGHDRDNVVPSCWTCNEKKSNMDFGMFMNWIQQVYQTRISL